jgi:hypothetical protein
VFGEKIVFWHRELPPLDAAVMAEHTVEANSNRVAGTIAHRSELWDSCYRELMASAEARIVTEIARLGGRYAHVRSESIGVKHDDAAGEAWLHGTFNYVTYSGDGPVPLGDAGRGDSQGLKDWSSIKS